jgi:GWxTD domain-containing protein
MLLGGLLGAAAPPAAPEAADSLTVHTVRFYRAGQDQTQTRVRAFLQLPYALLSPAGTGSEGDLLYHVTVEIADTSGTALFTEKWDGHAPGVLRGSGGYVMETLNFLIPAGQFDLRVTVRDSATAREFDTHSALVGFAASPTVSDLLLSPDMRQISAGDTVPRPGELLIGSTMVTAAAEVLLTPLRANLHYLFEAYAGDDQSGTMALAVEDAAGQVLIRTPPAAMSVPTDGAVFRGALDLTGLPEGNYDLRLELELNGVVVERRRQFRMAGMRETLARDSVRRVAARITDEGYFAAMNEEQLDSAKAPLLYIATEPDQLDLYDRLSVQAKRAYLTRFWKGRDPSPGSPRNEAREQFYAAVEYANRTFGEGRRGVPGWRTDRGRIFARNGRPADMLDKTRDGKAPPYQVWQYYDGKHRYYIFADRTSFGAYALMHSNDLLESGTTGWIEIMTVDAVLDIQDYLGVSFINPTGSSF